MRLLKLMLTGIASTAVLAACSGGASASGGDEPSAKNSGDEVAVVPQGADSRSYALSDFTGVSLSGPDTVIITEGAGFSVTAKGASDALNLLEISVKNGSLQIGRKPGDGGWNDFDKGAVITVTMPTLNAISLAGSGEMTADRASGDDVSVAVSGSGDLTIKAVAAKALNVSLSGSGDIELGGGSADGAAINLAGSGDVDAKDVTMATAKVSVAGSGDVAANVTGPADVAIIGSGDVQITGGGKCSVSAMGSGSADCR